MEKIESLINNIKEDVQKHSSIPFWSWNDKLDHRILAEQIKGMNSLGMRGFLFESYDVDALKEAMRREGIRI